MPSMRLKDKIALITGGTSGIGEATALLFAKEGAKVAITGRSQPRGAALVEQIRKANGEAVFVPTDVSVTAECESAVNQTLATFGRLGIPFDNSGMFSPQPALPFSAPPSY